MRTTLKLAAAVGALAVIAAGCQSAGGTDKTGSATVTLRLATIDEINPDGQSFGTQAFVDDLGKVSGGKLKVQVTTDYGQGDAQAETKLVTAIASGDVDGGWPATRAFANAGISGLKVVEAPMTITSYAAEKELVSGPVAAKLLGTLNGSGVDGLGLTVAGLRRPFAAKTALLGVTDWKGVRFRAFNSPVQDEALRDLGAIPVSASFDWMDQVRLGTLRGAEFGIAQYAKIGSTIAELNVTSNVVLWPKISVLSISHKRFAALSSQQQAWVREAAHQAVQASVNATYDDNTPAKQLCDSGVSFPPADGAQLASLRTAFRPTLAKLAADPTSGPLLRDLQAIAARHPQPEVAAPGECQLAAANGAIGPIPNTPSSLPDGTYRVSISLHELTAAGANNNGGFTGIWTLAVNHATYEVSCRPLDLPGTDCGHEVQDAPLEAGDLRGTDQTAYFVVRPDRLAKRTGCLLPPAEDLPGHCGPGTQYRMTWAVQGDHLTFSDFRPASVPEANYTIKPWKKIG